MTINEKAAKKAVKIMLRKEITKRLRRDGKTMVQYTLKELGIRFHELGTV